MFDIGWSELLLIGVVALIVIGPKDLPQMFRSLGRLTARARAMAREFSQAMEDAAKSSGLDDAANTLRDVKSMTSKKALGIDALERAADRFEKWEPKLPRSRTDAVPDPAAESPSAKAVAPTTPTPSPSGTTAATTGASAATPAVSSPVAPDKPASEPGQRRIRAVRRTDIQEG